MVEGLDGSTAGSLEQFASEEFGDLPDTPPEAPVTPAAPSSTPSSAEAATTPAVVAPDTKADVPEPAKAPAGDGAKPEDPSAAAPPDPLDDPLKDATPFTYGDGRAFDGIRVLPEAGAVIDLAALPVLQQRLVERDQFEAQVRDLYAKTQQYEGLRYTTKDEQGQPQEHRGVEAFRQLQIDMAKFDAAGQVLLDTTKQLLAENPEVWTSIQERLKFAVDKAGFARERSFTTDERVQAQTQQQAQNREQVFGGAIRQIKQALPHLTEQDIQAGEQMFRQFLPALFRPATVEEAKQFGFKVGEEVFDAPKMNGWFQDRAQLRTQEVQQAEARKQAEAARPKIDAENKARLAAAAQGAKPTARPVVSAKPKDEPKKSQRASDADAGWDLMEQLAH